MINLTNITKEFYDGTKYVEVLKPTDIVFKEGEFTAIIGPSGSGKSTLLTIMGALQKPTKGTLEIEGQDVYELSEYKRTQLRFDSIGFVLQGSNLVPYLTLWEQYELKLNRSKTKKSTDTIKTLFDKLSITHIKDKYPEDVSGGERQRAAIGLALINNPRILLADEPTASLDTEKAFQVVELLREVSREFGASVVMVTHDARMLTYCDRVLEIRDGVVNEKDISI